MALTEHEHLGFSYNTEREKLKIPEYGRTLQQMLDDYQAKMKGNQI